MKTFNPFRLTVFFPDIQTRLNDILNIVNPEISTVCLGHETYYPVILNSIMCLFQNILLLLLLLLLFGTNMIYLTG